MSRSKQSRAATHSVREVVLRVQKLAFSARLPYTFDIPADLAMLLHAFSAQKAEMKAQGPSPESITESGDIAAIVRIAHGLRAGLCVKPSNTE